MHERYFNFTTHDTHLELTIPLDIIYLRKDWRTNNCYIVLLNGNLHYHVKEETYNAVFRLLTRENPR